MADIDAGEASRHQLCSLHALRHENTTKVLAKLPLKYERISKSYTHHLYIETDAIAIFYDHSESCSFTFPHVSHVKRFSYSIQTFGTPGSRSVTI